MDSSLEVPLHTLKQSHGFSLDVGRSTIKVAYRSKHEYSNCDAIEGKELETKKGHIHLKLFPIDQVKEVKNYIKDHCDLKDVEGKRVIHVTGLGLSEDIREQIEAAFDCQVVIEDGDAMSGKALQYLLRNFKPSEAFFEPSAVGVRKGKRMAEAILKFMHGELNSRCKFYTSSSNLNFVEVRDEEFKPPAMCVDFGAACRFNKILNKEGEVERIGTAPFDGCFFHGICGFFSGTKDYASLLKMAEECDGKTVETTYGDFLEHRVESDEETLYSKKISLVEEDQVELRLFIMDKMVSGNREDAKVGDVVQSLLKTVCENISAHIYDVAKLAGVKKTYWGGSFVQPALVRQWLTMFLILRNSLIGDGDPLAFEFLRHGSYLGALGAFLQT